MADISQVKEITSRLEQGVKDIFTGDRYAGYLKTMSRFHTYSTRNTVLIHMQKPDASLVAGFGAWQTKFGRHVLKGEKSIKILAPTPFTIREEKEKLDPDTRLPVLDDNGMPVIEVNVKQLARFKVVSVFDVSQTDGKPIPSLAQDLTGNVEQYGAFMDALRGVSPLPVVFEALPEDTDGECRFGDRIAIREGMGEIQTVCAVIHEMAHAKLHDTIMTVDGENAPPPKDRRTEEVEAEAISFSVCAFFDIETGANSFAYIADWSAGKELKELNASLDTIRRSAAEMIDAIDARFQQIIKERDIQLTVDNGQLTVNTPEATAPSPQVSTVNAQPSTVLMPLLFEGGNLNRNGKRTRVKAEPPIGKYSVYSHDEHGTNYLYLLTGSGMLINAGETSRCKDLTEQRISEYFADSIEAFDKQLADPKQWADFTAAAIADRIADADAHNVPVREMREAESLEQAQERRERVNAVRKEREQIFNANVDEIEARIMSGEKAGIEYDHNMGKNPLLALFDKYEIEVPIATKGWVNRNLKAFQITDKGVVAWLPKGVKASDVFNHALYRLKKAIEAAHVRASNEPAHVPESEPPKTAAPDMSRPDPLISDADRDAYGYSYEEMLPLSTAKAAELFDANLPIYLLHTDDTETAAFDKDDILNHDGLCGIERRDWESSMVYLSQTAIAVGAEGARESELLHGDDSFGIYQIKGGDEMRDYLFEAHSRLKDMGLSVNRGNYELVYTAPISDIFEPGTNRDDILNQVYETFNLSQPKDYTGRSLSVSDVIVLNYGGEASSHYVDSFGFTELFNFTGEEKQPVKESEMPELESNSQAAKPPTVAELEADARSGKPISLMELSRAVKAESRPKAAKPARKRKPTLMEQLAEGKRLAAAHNKKHAHKTNNREV